MVICAKHAHNSLVQMLFVCMDEFVILRVVTLYSLVWSYFSLRFLTTLPEECN